jgi:hypothetical protein
MEVIKGSTGRAGRAGNLTGGQAWPASEQARDRGTQATRLLAELREACDNTGQALVAMPSLELSGCST